MLRKHSTDPLRDAMEEAARRAIEQREAFERDVRAAKRARAESRWRWMALAFIVGLIVLLWLVAVAARFYGLR